MKTVAYAVILGLVLLLGLGLWQRGTRSQPESPRPQGIEPIAALPPAEKFVGARIAPGERETTDRFLERVAVDVTIMLAQTDPIRRDENLQLLVDSIGFNEIPTVLQYLQQQEQTRMLQDLQVLLVRKGAAIDSKAAAAWVQRMSAGTTRTESIAGVGVVWAGQNLLDAARWASELAEGEDRENGLAHVAHEAARTQPILALELAANLAPNDARDELIRHATSQWASEDAVAAVAWTSEITNPALREQLLADIAVVWGETDPGSAAALALQSLAGGKTQDDALIGIAQQWVQKEPFRASAWVLEFPESLQRSALENVVRLWADKDALQAEKWADALSGAQREIALHALAAR